MSDLVFMQRALNLARLGLGKVSPNPMVGAVIVHENKIIGEGWHTQYGFPHAEVEAVKSVSNLELLAESTIYVTLEPCSHFGKTPPCADLLVRHRFKKVVVAMLDPNPLVAGKGIEKLRDAGIEVEIGVLEQDAKCLNKRYLTYFEKQRPYVILKWAQTSDGFIAPSLNAEKEKKQISNPLSSQLVHKWRSEEDAIMVGMNTLLHDNPKLTVRQWSTSKHPVRVTLDEKGILDFNYHFFDQSGPAIIFNYEKDEIFNDIKFIKISKENTFAEMLSCLKKEGVGSVLVEGGTALLNRFVEANLWDEARVCTSPKIFRTGIKAPIFCKNPDQEFVLDQDKWRIYLNN